MLYKSAAICVICSGILSADIVNVSPTAVDYGTQPLGVTTSQSVILTNPTKKSLYISSISATGDFASPSDTCHGVVDPGQQCSITVTFRPTVLGDRAGILSVNDDANNTPQNGGPAVVWSVYVSPHVLSLKLGQTNQSSAMATYTDGSGQDITAAATWSTTATAVATVSPSGLVTATGAGNASIHATYAGFSDTISVTVSTPVLTGVRVSPGWVILAPGFSQQFKAVGIFDNGLSTSDISASVTWQSSDPSTCPITASGVATCTQLVHRPVSSL